MYNVCYGDRDELMRLIVARLNYSAIPLYSSLYLQLGRVIYLAMLVNFGRVCCGKACHGHTLKMCILLLLDLETVHILSVSTMNVYNPFLMMIDSIGQPAKSTRGSAS